ncbi:MAG TPA: hypothetical protein VIF86_04800 [Methylobacter sp.]
MTTSQKEFKVEYQAGRKQVILSKRVAGHVLPVGVSQRETHPAA